MNHHTSSKESLKQEGNILFFTWDDGRGDEATRNMTFIFLNVMVMAALLPANAGFCVALVFVSLTLPPSSALDRVDVDASSRVCWVVDTFIL